MRVDVASKTDPTRSSGETLTGAALAFGLVDARRGGHTNHAHTT